MDSNSVVQATDYHFFFYISNITKIMLNTTDTALDIKTNKILSYLTNKQYKPLSALIHSSYDKILSHF